MKPLTNTQLALLDLLGDGHCHSGSELGQTLHVSRTAIWKQINQLVAYGLPINTLPQQGYQLTNPLILLNAEQISNQLNALHCKIPFNLHLMTSVDSTNRFLNDLPTTPLVDVSCAETQTKGRGRLGRTWHSPFGENIYCSSRWHFNDDLNKLSGLSLVVSLSVLTTLQQVYPSTFFKIKWPNDVFWNDEKICGCLIDIQAESNGNAQMIIGIGLNVNSETHHPLPGGTSWCSLRQITHQSFNRNLIIASLLFNLSTYLRQFETQGFEAFINEWDAFDYLKGKEVSIIQANRQISGIALGVNPNGLLKLQESDGTQHVLSSGDASVRVRPEPV